MHLERVDVWREEQHGAGPAGEMRMGDVLELLPSLVDEYAGKVQLIYLDPPFYTNQKYAVKQRVGTAGYTGKKDYLLSVENDFDIFVLAFN